jgi:large subunit ribosomal protein L30e
MITTEQIRKLIEEKKVTIGTDETMRALRAGTVKTLVIATNTDAQIREGVERAASVSGVSIDDLAISNDQLGTMCKKPFAISILGIAK